MSRRRSSGTRARTHRTRRRHKSGLIECVMIAGIFGGGLYLLLHSLLTVPARPAAYTGFALGLITFGIVIAHNMRLPYLRSPVGWRRR